MFYSDVAFDMSGFNITYRVGGCPYDCSNHGDCRQDVCSCNPGFTGEACEIEYCPQNCSNHGSCIRNKCVCYNGYIGPDCSQKEGNGLWIQLNPDKNIAGRASHAVVKVDDSVWVVGGYSFARETSTELMIFNLTQEKWTDSSVKPSTDISPQPRHGHSVVLFENQLYMYGGVVGNNISNELWMFHIGLRTWTFVRDSTGEDRQLAVSGHASHVVNGVMHVLFGHSPVYGFLPFVQEFHFNNKSWILPNTTGAMVKSTCWYSSVYDEDSGLIFVYGGYHSVTTASNHLTDKMYSYNPRRRYWSILNSSGSPRFLHSAVLINGYMLTFGGNTHNETSANMWAKCYSPDFMAYDIKCNRWYNLKPPYLHKDLSRFGHSTVEHNGSMYIFLGFKGQMLNDVVKYIPGNCSAYTEETSCINSRTGNPCIWENGACIVRSPTSDRKNSSMCLNNTNNTSMCHLVEDCKTCLSINCRWCSNKCLTLDQCLSKKSTLVNHVADCPADAMCTNVHSCALCQLEPNCTWLAKEKKCVLTKENAPKRLQCPVPCQSHTSCENCTREECMWCNSAQRCVDMNSYVVSFLYGQCTKWDTEHNFCSQNWCSDIRTCTECQKNPICGWCNDKSNTGLGRCMEGGKSGPAKFSWQRTANYNNVCPAERWYFVSCPLCQCNGHSTCNESNICTECQNNTKGDNCDSCREGYFGSPHNGGTCKTCECNNLAKVCDETNGKCHCGTRGVIGNRCEWCDTSEKYVGNPNDGGTCYYKLLTDYQFTFNLSKADDQYYTQINFMNRPSAGDRDVDFSVNCSGFANLNISYNSTSDPEGTFVESNAICRNYKMKFTHKQYAFGDSENTTFYVYVYGFTTPFSLQITFTQQPNIDLVNFFVTFFSCFLSLLLIAAIFWKIKQRYDVYRRRQRMFVELEQMASRPFAVVSIDIERKMDGYIAEKKEIPDYRKKKKLPKEEKKAVNNKPSPIALEPLNGQKAAVLSLLVQLPCGDEDYTPSNQSGLSIASALVSLGNPRKQSSEPSKCDKNKLRKHIHQSHPDACI